MSVQHQGMEVGWLTEFSERHPAPSQINVTHVTPGNNGWLTLFCFKHRDQTHNQVFKPCETGACQEMTFICTFCAYFLSLAIPHPILSPFSKPTRQIIQPLIQLRSCRQADDLICMQPVHTGPKAKHLNVWSLYAVLLYIYYAYSTL